MTCKEFSYSTITFSICNALTSKILAIIISLIKSGLYYKTFMLLKAWYKETNKLEMFCFVQFVCENIILLTSLLMLILSKCLNRKNIYIFFKILTNIIIVYLFLVAFLMYAYMLVLNLKNFQIYINQMKTQYLTILIIYFHFHWKNILTKKQTKLIYL
jgi:hypothetical protein